MISFNFRKIVFTLFLVFGTTLLSYAQPFKGCPKGTERVKQTNITLENEVLVLVNKERTKRKLKPLLLDSSLSNSARYHSADMATDAYFDHNTCDANKKLQCKVFDRIGKFAANYFDDMAENISAGDTDAAGVMKSWMNSSGHRQNILNKKYTHIGIGYFHNPNDKEEYYYYWCQTFGKKKH